MLDYVENAIINMNNKSEQENVYSVSQANPWVQFLLRSDWLQHGPSGFIIQLFWARIDWRHSTIRMYKSSMTKYAISLISVWTAEILPTCQNALRTKSIDSYHNWKKIHDNAWFTSSNIWQSMLSIMCSDIVAIRLKRPNRFLSA